MAHLKKRVSKVAPHPSLYPEVVNAANPQHTSGPVVLIIRDGWGKNPHSEQDSYNAVKLARTPCANDLEKNWPHTLIKTSGEDVGLPIGPDGPVMGNSEVGHQNIGAGRIVDQELMRITRAIRSGEFARNASMIAAFEHAKNRAPPFMSWACSATVKCTATCRTWRQF